MNLKRISAIAKKEVFHILRDPFTLGLAIFLPLILVVIFGLAIELNVAEIPVSIVDEDNSASSRQLKEIMGSSRFFLPGHAPNAKEAIRQLDANKIRTAIIIDHGFEKNISAGNTADLQVLLDGSDSSTVSSTIGYLNRIEQISNEKIAGHAPPEMVTIKTRFLYNPELNSRWFVVPGLMVIILAILSILLTALTVAREWENGSMELLLSTPASAMDIIMGKLAPYIALGFVAVLLVYLIARLFLGVPFNGNHLIFITGCFLFLSTCLALGLLISVATRDQRTAMQIALMASLLPSILLSGFIFPIESMSSFFQGLTAALPARWFLTLCLDSFLKSPNLLSLKTPLLVLLGMTGTFVLIAAKRFKKDVEP